MSLLDSMMRAPEPGENPKDQIRKKHNEYYAEAQRYRFLYYTTRLVAGLCAGLLPFVISSAPAVATGFSIATVIDAVLGPQERWRALSLATDLLYVAELKKQGKYEEFAESLKIILTTEDQQMFELLGLDDVIQKAKDSAETACSYQSSQKVDIKDQEPVGETHESFSSDDTKPGRGL